MIWFHLLQVGTDAAVHGFRVMLRIEEIWPLLARAQAFPNWFTKLKLCLRLACLFMLPPCTSCCHFLSCLSLHPRKDNVTHEVSKRWKVDYNVHILRKSEYKGGRVNLEEMKLRLPFNACTFPGFFFVAPQPEC